MLVSVYLDRDVIDVLECFGELSDVINRILDAATEGHFDMLDKPSPGPRDGAIRREVNITNEDYLALVRSFPVNSPRTSLRRLVHWFVENEMYAQLGWELVRVYREKDTSRIKHQLDKLVTETAKLHVMLSDMGYSSHESRISIILSELEALRSTNE